MSKKKAAQPKPAAQPVPLQPLPWSHQRVTDLWRSVLGLPPDFPITEHQLVVCMSMATMAMDEYKDMAAKHAAQLT